MCCLTVRVCNILEIYNNNDTRQIILCKHMFVLCLQSNGLKYVSMCVFIRVICYL